MHSLRHTFATLSLEAGRSVKLVSQQLGHRDASLTLNTYAHALPDEETDLSFLSVASAGADPRWTGASTKLRSVTLSPGSRHPFGGGILLMGVENDKAPSQEVFG